MKLTKAQQTAYDLLTEMWQDAHHIAGVKSTTLKKLVELGLAEVYRSTVGFYPYDCYRRKSE